MTIYGLPPLSKPIIRHECPENLLSDSVTCQAKLEAKVTWKLTLLPVCVHLTWVLFQFCLGELREGV